jgi:hypothetical protein
MRELILHRECSIIKNMVDAKLIPPVTYPVSLTVAQTSADETRFCVETPAAVYCFTV